MTDSMQPGPLADYFDAVARDIIAYTGFIKDYQTYEECAADGQLRSLCERIMGQITEAAARREKTPAADAEDIVRDAFFKGGEILPVCMKAADNSARVKASVLLIKQQGLFPYFAAKFAATAVYVMVRLGAMNDPAEFVDKFRFEREAQLSALISEEYAKIADGSIFIDDLRRIGIMSAAYENGFAGEAEYTGCCQCTLKAFFETHGSFGETEKELFKAGNGLQGGGASCTDSACGSYSACNMAISRFFGRSIDDYYKKNPDPGAKCDALGRSIRDKFLKTYGSVNCRDIHMKIFGRQFDFTLPSDGEAFDERGGHFDKCPAVVGLTSAWLAGTIYDEGLF